METSRKKLIGDRTPKDFGIRKTLKKRPWYYGYCTKKGCKRRKQPFGGWTPQMAMGNLAMHEQWHDEQDRKAAETAGVN